jgi:hypothetical protein
MKPAEITQNRLANLHISNPYSGANNPEDVLKSLGAMQAQDFQAALWAIGLRCKGSTQKDVEETIEKRKISRTWLMRGTLHIAASPDIHWMLELFAPRLISTAITRDRHLGLSDKTITKSEKLFERALEGGKQLTRDDMYKVLEKGGISTKSQLGYHLLYRAAWDGLICFGAHEGKQPTFVLLEEWIGKRAKLSRDQALAELASRYFTSHGPATIKDYLWWSGLKVSDARMGIEMASPKLVAEEIESKTYYMPKSKQTKGGDYPAVHLLPAFDEYLVGYSDRSAMLRNQNTQKMLRSGKLVFVHSNGIFLPTIVADGEVVGTWKRTNEKEKVYLTMLPFMKLTKKHIEGIELAADLYAEFLEKPVVVRPIKS